MRQSHQGALVDQAIHCSVLQERRHVRSHAHELPALLNVADKISRTILLCDLLIHSDVLGMGSRTDLPARCAL